MWTFLNTIWAFLNTIFGWPFVSTMFGGLVSIGAVVLVEYLRRPNLALSKEDPPLEHKYDPASRPATEMRSLRVNVSNRTLPGFARWMVRAPALQCRAAITFHHLDEQDIFGRTMEGRWPNTPEPAPIVIAPSTPEGQHIALIPQTRGWVDLQPGESEPLDIAMRADNDAECYGWNNEAYFSTPIWRNPNWRLGPGRYLARVIVTSSGRKCIGWFQLENSVGRESFRLEPYTPRFQR
jgi:hypothetical protein